VSQVVLGIDPGTRKAGYAVVDDRGRVLEQGIEELEPLITRVRHLASERPIAAIALGHGTNAEPLRCLLCELGPPVSIVNEHETTLQARKLYFEDHPPRGWRRLIPLGMQLPPRPVDDYAAVLIARRFLTLAGPELPLS
jgi:RNase H-fold protein (predicted Holliday junction resolvase)